MPPSLTRTAPFRPAVRTIRERLAALRTIGVPIAAKRMIQWRIAAERAIAAVRATALGTVLLAGVLAGCTAAAPTPTPPITPGTAANPREVNIIARDYTFAPPTVDLVPGETVLLHIINGGLEVHEVVIGDGAVQDAWEAAEAATVGAPPGPTPIVAVAPELAGLRVVVRSGERRDVRWTVPQAPTPGGALPTLVVGCHIPGHWARGMVVPIQFVAPGG